MIHEKPFKNCNGCDLYGEQCHCLCHKSDILDGFHEIIYNNGEGSKIIEIEGERD